MTSRKRKRDAAILVLGGLGAAGALALASRARASSPPVTGEPRFVRGRVQLPEVADIEPVSRGAGGADPSEVSDGGSYHPYTWRGTDGNVHHSTHPPRPSERQGYDPARARRLAGQLYRNMQRNPRHGAWRDSIRAFQLAAGISADGRYGGLTANALRYFGIHDPPPPHEPPGVEEARAEYDP